MALIFNNTSVPSSGAVVYNNVALQQVRYGSTVVWKKALEIFGNGVSYYGAPYLQVGNGYVNTTSGYASIYFSSNSGDVYGALPSPVDTTGFTMLKFTLAATNAPKMYVGVGASKDSTSCTNLNEAHPTAGKHRILLLFGLQPGIC